jgi:hypothetical protein
MHNRWQLEVGHDCMWATMVDREDHVSIGDWQELGALAVYEILAMGIAYRPNDERIIADAPWGK